MSDENQGAWIITRVYSRTGVAIDVKAAGANVAAAIENMYAGLAIGIEQHGWTTEQAGAPKSAGTAVTPQGATASTTPAPAQAVIGNMPNIDTSINTMEIVRVKVTPKPDDKVELQLFAQGHKFADLYHNGTVKQVLAALSGTGLAWNEEHLRVAAEFDSHFYADWRNSDKLNSKGNPYKNVINYRAITATA